MQVSDRTPEVTAFHSSAEWTGVMDEDRARWLETRRTMVTASDVAAIMGEDPSPHRTAMSVYLDKVMGREEASDPTLSDPWLWGSVLEQPILTTVARLSGWQYRRGGALLRSRRWPHLGCTLDAEVDRGDAIGWVPLEGKTSQVTRDWDEDAQNIPTRVLLQVQAQGAVTQAQELPVFALLVGCRPCLVTLQPDRDLQQIIVEKTHEFMERVAKMEPPPAGPHDAFSLFRLYPQDDGSVRQLPAEVLEWTREIREIAAKEKELKSRGDTLRNSIKRILESATYGELPEAVDGARYWKCGRVKRAQYTVKEAEYRDLRLVKKVASK